MKILINFFIMFGDMIRFYIRSKDKNITWSYNSEGYLKGSYNLFILVPAMKNVETFIKVVYMDKKLKLIEFVMNDGGYFNKTVFTFVNRDSKATRNDMYFQEGINWKYVLSFKKIFEENFSYVYQKDDVKLIKDRICGLFHTKIRQNKILQIGHQ